MKQTDVLKDKFDQVMVLYRSNQVMKAIDQVQELLTMANEMHDHYYCATSYNFLGVLYTALGNVSRGIDYYFEAMIYAEKNHVNEVLAPVYNNIGSHYLDVGAFDQALKYLKKGEKKSGEIYENSHVGLDIQLQRKIINAANIALAYTNLKEYEKSNEYISKAQSLMKDKNAEGISFACSFLYFQNQYYLGNIEYVRKNLGFLINGIEELVSLYSYEQNITEMFEFLLKIDEQEKLMWLLQIVENFADTRTESHYKLLALKLRGKYEKRYGDIEKYRETCEKLVDIYEEKEKEILHEREQYMNLRMEMKQTEDEREEAQKRLADMIQTVINQEYEYIAYIDTQKDVFSVHVARKFLKNISTFDSYENMLTNYIMKQVVETDKNTLLDHLQISFVKKQLEQQEDYSIIIKSIDKDEKITYKKLLFTYIDKSYDTLLLAQMDITELIQEERKQKKLLTDALREAENANIAKTEFLSKMSHEIRTPLNAIIGYINMAQNNHDDREKLNSFHGKANIAANHLLSIINDVLDLSAIASGHFKIEHAEFDFKQIVGDINAMFMQQAIAKDIDFSINVSSLSYEILVGDTMRVKQILLNLLSNAMKFTPVKGKITLYIDQSENSIIGEDGIEKVQMKFKVQDTGIGMTNEFMNKIFTPFEQQDASISRKYGGTGLGLSISKQLVEMMGGNMSVESEENVGTVFTVNIPFDFLLEESREDNHVDFTKIRTLLVDADQEASKYNKSLLKKLKLKADTTADFDSAKHKLEVRQGGTYGYQLCIINDSIGVKHTENLVNYVREHFESKIFIIVLMKSGDFDYEEKLTKAGVDFIVEKPLFQSVLFDFILSKYGKVEKKLQKETVANFNGLHILLAEDNEMNMEIAEDILTRVNLIVDKATDGKKAYEKFVQAPTGTYQAILMDIQMPEMDGYEATKAIRNSEHPEGKTIPIIALTANAFTEDVHRALEAGMNGHIAKPINTKELFEMLSKVIL